MGRYLLIRLAQAPLILFVLITISFFFIRFAPGGPFTAERNLDPVTEQALLEKYRLDQPLWMQYIEYLSGILHGDLGPSFKQKSMSVNEIISLLLPSSMFLGTLALLLALIFGIGAGIIAGIRHQTFGDHAFMLMALFGLSIPTFVIGPMLALLFAIHLDWLPLAGYEGPGSPSYLVLPALTLSLPFAARIARMMRSGMIEVLRHDYVRTARAKGVSECGVVLVHAFRNAVLPVIAMLGLDIGIFMSGAVVVESIYGWPGIGQLAWQAIQRIDIPIIMGVTLVAAVAIVIGNLLADVVASLIDPRIKLR